MPILLIAKRGLHRASAFIFIILVAVLSLPILVSAQLTNPAYNPIIPAAPTSANTIRAAFKYRDKCGFLYGPNSYTTKMEQNKITVTFLPGATELNEQTNLAPPDPFADDAVIVELGKLPSGKYTLTSIGSPCGIASATRPSTDFTDYPFTVAEARTLPGRKFPSVRENFSGHWWDPAEPGSGLFITHDEKENFLAVWVTYDAEGKSVWYVYQPPWVSPTNTDLAPMWLASKPTANLSDKTMLKEIGMAHIRLEALKVGTFANPIPNAGQVLSLYFKPTGKSAEFRKFVRFAP